MSNGNCYLRLQLAEDTTEILQGISQTISDDVSSWLLGRCQRDETQSPDGRPLAFEPQEDLHITHVFFGEALHTASRDAICEVHRLVEEALADSSLDLERPSDVTDAAEEQGSHMALEIDKFELFPPDKQNLVIARLKFASRKEEIWARRLYLHVHDACAKMGVKLRGAPQNCGQTCEAVVIENSFSFQPHITLGKIRTDKTSLGAVTLRLLNGSLCADSPANGPSLGLPTLDDGSVDRGVKIAGISMGGQPPKRVYFDWDALTFPQ